MALIPETSTTLLRDLAQETPSARWGEFVRRYRPMMEAFLRERFPSVDADDVMQETLVALRNAMPSYRYVPGENGHFRNYLTGILRHRAIRAVEAEKCRDSVKELLRRDAPQATDAAADEENEWKRSLMEIALQQLLSDESVHALTREVFRRVAVNGEKPEAVGLSLGISRNAVDQMKSRMMAKLKRLVKALGDADGQVENGGK